MRFYADAELPEPRPDRNAAIVDFMVRKDIHHVGFCGAFTQRTKFPGLSEARVMSEYVRAKLPAGYLFFPHHDEDSYMTVENGINGTKIVRFLQNLLWEDQPPRPGELTFFCEADRYAKVRMLNWFLLPDYRPRDGDGGGVRIHYRAVSWERANPLVEFLMKLPNELLMYFIPPWRQFMRWLRIAKCERQ